MAKKLTPMDAAFLLLERRRLPMHVAGLYIFSPPPGSAADHVKRLYERWRGHLQAEPPFNLHPEGHMSGWAWQTDEAFDVDYHLRHLALPEPGRIRELLALVSRLHGTLLDRSRPLWEVYLIEGLADGRFALYFKLHHALVDGVSAIRLISESFATDPAQRKPPPWAQAHGMGAVVAGAADAAVDWSARLRQVWQIGSELLPGLRSGLVDLLRKPARGEARVHPLQAPPTLFNVKVTGARRVVAQRYAMARFRAIGQAGGLTINDVTLALSAAVLRRYLTAQNALPDKPLVAMVPVSLHAEGSAGGNQVGMILADLATEEADVAERLRRIKASTTAGKERLRSLGRSAKLAYAATLLMPLGIDVLSGRAAQRPSFNLVISNVPGPREQQYLDGARLDECYPLSIPVDYQAMNITVTSYRDELSFGFVACRKAVPHLQRMLDYLDEAFLELEQMPLSLPVPRKPAAKPRAPAPAKRARRAPAPAAWPDA
ncbi:diacylglycerol O-acyltransferase [Paucibacter oligotrophus]|uniref:diacylglycerol O-acyltransferase n=1 Tax=Roseateles oligotrophus TaxID=1769250 RepID=A0A840L7C7_9BURK|nr:wax ester/triacylglycerol synthase family O-acyltransferase [Roseateles oligotrophus]MBB4843681.1 diacylglycerol O-acyltransferase [Roseateles oligotrophus]